MIQKMGLILLIIAFPVALILVSQKTGFFSKAGGSIFPEDVKVTNISDHSFVVSWRTPHPTTGFIKYGSDQSVSQAAQDEQDVKGLSDHTVHYVIVKDLQASTKYYFKISSGDQLYGDDGQPYTQTTFAQLSSTPGLPSTLFGRVIDQNGRGIPFSVVYVTNKNSTILSDLTDESGGWLVTLNNARDLKTGDEVKVNLGDQLNVKVYTSDEKMDEENYLYDVKGGPVESKIEVDQSSSTSSPESASPPNSEDFPIVSFLKNLFSVGSK